MAQVISALVCAFFLILVLRQPDGWFCCSASPLLSGPSWLLLTCVKSILSQQMNDTAALVFSSANI